jgi:hypothetical protein
MQHEVVPLGAGVWLETGGGVAVRGRGMAKDRRSW